MASEDDQRGTLIALEPRIQADFHPLYHEIAERRDLTAGPKLVYTVLVSYHQRFKNVFPGRERLAKDTGLSERQLVDHIKALVDVGLLQVKRRGQGRTNVYTLLKWPAPRSAESALLDIPEGTSGDAESALPFREQEEEQKKPRNKKT